MKYLTLLWISFAPVVLFSQNTITVEPADGSASSIYTDLQTALGAAPAGSDVIVSGGVWNASNANSVFYIDKRIHLIGTGFDVDSTKATGKSVIAGNFYINPGAEGSVIEGLDFHNGINVQCPNVIIKFVRTSFLSCHNNTYIKNSNIGTIYVAFRRGIKVENTVFYTIHGINGQTIIENSIFEFMSTVANCICRNNIIIGSQGNSSSFGGNYFDNNIFTFPQSSSFINSTFDFAQNNKYNVNLSTVFQTYDPALLTNAGVYTNFKEFNWQVKSGSAADNAGTDGTDCGIYGGLTPWKEGAVPTNPHIQSKTIAPATDAQGKLNVNIRVKAQGN